MDVEIIDEQGRHVGTVTRQAGAPDPANAYNWTVTLPGTRRRESGRAASKDAAIAAATAAAGQMGVTGPHPKPPAPPAPRPLPRASQRATASAAG